MGLSRSFQITNIFPNLSVFENLRCGVLWSMGYKYTFLRFLSRPGRRQ
jgi:branched-chain amino acid transport system ATP-binding protein